MLREPRGDGARTFGSSGYVAETVPLALLGAEAMMRDGFEEQLQPLIDVSADADTTGSIAGQVAGAAVGLGGIPRDLCGRLPEASRG